MRPNSPYHQVGELSLICSQPAGHGYPDRLDERLSMGADPNTLPEKAKQLLSTIEPGWVVQDPPPQFEQYGEQFQAPLYCAANRVDTSPKGHEEKAQMTISLLRHGSDPYQEFPQALCFPDRSSKPRAPFPGEDPPRTSYPDPPMEAHGLDWEEKNGHPHFSDDEWDSEEPTPVWGARHLIHAIIEDGIWLKPLMDYHGFLESLDLEHRDPQGRTLLLSACRSTAGADILAGAALVDVNWRVEKGEAGQKLYPSWDRFLGPSESDFSDSGSESLIEVFLRLGADPLAVDDQGKNALHHLLVEASNNRYSGLPIVRRSLRIISSRYQSLVDQPDHHGTYPLHAALRRMRLHPLAESRYPVAMAEPLGCVQDLIRAGADPRAKDRKGNTALHYLADDDLTAIWHGTEKRQLFYDLLKIAFYDDINMRNNAGKTVAELILDDNGCMDDDKAGTFHLANTDEDRDFRSWLDVDTEVLEALDEAGYDWKAKTSESGNLLHIVARSGLDQRRLILRSRFLVQKGIDANEPDADGWTARKIAEHYKLNKVGFYAELERLEQGEVEEYWRTWC
ncbi:ankyrin repeats (3 copies) domain-containing protein [Fusarium pseudoanthophilum]|uniref:Ankyrin repeats (3 copies) domain-containing protein n=1 Tax=Fusarium pseudoanthophilum TaxID=48495 RepID=A0A8H5KR06_9HYPO|nr:ankyrin repeats (3 copies) domain-containing protein [Fusarium pseudoanthophilum]